MELFLFFFFFFVLWLPDFLFITTTIAFLDMGRLVCFFISLFCMLLHRDEGRIVTETVQPFWNIL